MSDIRSIDGLAPFLQRSAGSSALRGSRGEDGGTAVQDRVEFSDLALALGSQTEIRADKVADVRRAIARGDYLTDNKLAIAIQRAVQQVEAEQ